jgi:hypothetical protein
MGFSERISTVCRLKHEIKSELQTDIKQGMFLVSKEAHEQGKRTKALFAEEECCAGV